MGSGTATKGSYAEMGRILIVEDDDDIRELLRASLELHGHVTIPAATGEQGLRLALGERPHLVLLDIMLPDVTGFEVCQRLRGGAMTSHIPIIMLTARGETADKLAGFEMGADDYITKPFDTDELLARVEVQLRHVERNLLSELTGLPGNTQIEQSIKRLIEMGDEHWAILYVDIDHFKEYNDVYGFIQGNEVIKATGRILQEAVRQCGTGEELDFVGHIGGDDFVVITRPERAEKISRHIIRRFDAIAPTWYSQADRERGYIVAADRRGNVIKIPLATVSIGVVTNRYRGIENHWVVGQIAAEVKKRAKALPGSAYYVDQRR